MNSHKIPPPDRPTFAPLLMLYLLASLVSVRAEGVQHLSAAHPGGFPGWPLLTGIERTTNGVVVTWDGPSGYYQLYQKPTPGSPTWQKVGSPSLARKATITTLTSNAFFKVAGPSPRYAGADVCLECHDAIHKSELNTRHASAFIDPAFVAQGGQTNSACLVCHTVGYGLPTGFLGKNDRNTNPRLAGVQCESCHGPAANHAANELDLTVRPRVELAGQLCGGCHNGIAGSTFDEWQSSGHFAVVEDMSPTSRIDSCGRCHSGSARLELIKGHDPRITATNDANVGITCAVCHDPHAVHVTTNVISGSVITNQLRYPLASTNDYSLSTNDVFATKYNTNLNLCAQCHNQRGASWSSTSEPPHRSPQYNMLLGTAGELDAGVTPWRSSHATRIKTQCVACHMQTAGEVGKPGPIHTGHMFRFTTTQICSECHDFADLLKDFAQMGIGVRIAQVKTALDRWAQNKAPAALRTKYGARAWEYTKAGELSGGTGPDLAEQALIPDLIKKARFNLYLVQNDGSFGIHNPPHAAELLDAAAIWVGQELKR